MRIIGGEARGRKLFAPEGIDTRPTPDRVRESLFNILMRQIPGARVLDLFGGSGAMALEALSRGAHSAVICDHAPSAIKAIRRNSELTRVQDRCQIIQADWRTALSRPAIGPFSLVFLDPPYQQTELYGLAAQTLSDRRLLAPGAVLVMEYELNAPALPDGFEVFDERAYGRTKVRLVRAVAGPEDPE